MLIGLSPRAAVDINVLHDRNPLFVTLSDGSIRNGYTIKILNKSHEPQHYDLDARAVSKARRSSVVGQDGRGARARPSCGQAGQRDHLPGLS